MLVAIQVLCWLYAEQASLSREQRGISRQAGRRVDRPRWLAPSSCAHRPTCAAGVGYVAEAARGRRAFQLPSGRSVGPSADPSGGGGGRSDQEQSRVPAPTMIRPLTA